MATRYEHDDGRPYDDDEMAAALDREDEQAAFESEVEAWVNRAVPRMTSIHDSKRLYLLLQKIGASYPDDPGTSDLYDEQPVSVSLNLGDVRLAWRLLR